MRRIIVFLFTVLWINGFSQEIRTWLSDDTVRFAQATQLNIRVKVPSDKAVVFPQLTDTLAKDLEVGRITIDTNDEHGIRELIWHAQIFPFKDTVFDIPSLAMRIGTRVVTTDSLRLTVLPMEIDSAQVAKIDTSQVIDVFDVKPPINPKLTLRELWLRYRYWLLGLLLAALLAYLLYKLYRKYQQWKQQKDIPQELQLPPHVLALKRLKELEEKRLYQKGDFKNFYFYLSEIVRQYLERRFYIRALEATTSELKLLLQASPEITQEWRQRLSDLFDTADLAKFADYKPLPDVAARHLKLAYDFVEATKPQPQDEENKDELQVVNQENLEQ